MKILIVGSDYVWSIERFYLKYIKEQNPNTTLFPAQNFFFDYLNQSVLNKIKHRLHVSDIYHIINENLWKEIESFKPDWIFVFKGMQVLPETLIKAKTLGIKLANFNGDNPFIFTGRGSGNSFVSRSITLYDLHFTYSFAIKEQLERVTNIPVKILPFGHNVPEEHLSEILNEQEINVPCFLGNPDKERARFIKGLNRNGIHLVVYGNNWKQFISPVQNTIHPAVYGVDFFKILRKYRVQLNMMRVHNLQSHNMRTFEIPAVGGIQLAPDTPEHRLYFEVDKEIFVYRNEIDCAKKISEIISMTTNNVNELRTQIFNKSRLFGFSYKDRALQVYNTLKSFH